MNQKIKIFLIYTSDDNNIMLQLLSRLQALNKRFKITIWHDDPIHKQQQWKPQIESRINDADIFLLLLSDAFMHSEFINQLEFKLIIDRYKDGTSKVIPILINKCQWDIDFSADDYNFNFKELRLLPEKNKPIVDWNSPDKILDNITAVVASEIGALTAETNQEVAHKKPEVTSIESGRVDQVELNFTEESKAARIAKEENKSMAEAEVVRKAEEANRNGQEAEAQRRAEEKKRQDEKVAAKQRAQEKNKLKEEANRAQIQSKADLKVKEEQENKNKKPNKTILLGSLIALFAIGGIWIFSLFNEDSEKLKTPKANEQTIDEAVSPSIIENEIDSVKMVEPIAKLAIGAAYDGGLVFSISPDSKTGKIVAAKDAGPMPWKNAIKIHKQLGEGWRLPTLDELKTIYQTIGQGATNSGQFANGAYWSATFYDDYQARLLRFSDGNASYHYNRENEERKFRVRAVKDFSR